MTEISARFDLLTNALAELSGVNANDAAGRFYAAIAELDSALATDADVAALTDMVRAAAEDGAITDADAAAFENMVAAFNARDAQTLEQAITDATLANGETEGGGKKSWFAALAEALGKLLDKGAGDIAEKSGAVGDDAKPSDLIKLNEAISKFGFHSGMAKTALDGAGQALNTLARPS